MVLKAAFKQHKIRFSRFIPALEFYGCSATFNGKKLLDRDTVTIIMYNFCSQFEIPLKSGNLLKISPEYKSSFMRDSLFSQPYVYECVVVCVCVRTAVPVHQRGHMRSRLGFLTANPCRHGPSSWCCEPTTDSRLPHLAAMCI